MQPEAVGVLVVDDSDAESRATEKLLRPSADSPFRVCHARTLLAAREQLSRVDVDVMLVELGLPECQGMQTLQTLAQAAPKVPQVVLTRIGDELQTDAAERGAQGYLVKGEASPPLLQRTLRYAIERNRSVQMARDMKKSIDAAREIQQHLIPDKVPELKGFDIAAGCFPAERCSGDVFDFIRMKGGLTIVLADVAGHGFGPAMLGAAVSAYLEAGAAVHQDIHEMLTMANWLIAKKTDGQFVTAVCVRINPIKRTMRYCAAGHRSYLIHASGQVKMLDALSTPLGVSEDEMLSLSLPVRLKHGDILVLMTDGIWEARAADDREFGFERALRAIYNRRNLPAREMVAALHQEVLDFCQPRAPVDDVTMVIVKVLDSPDQAETSLD